MPLIIVESPVKSKTIQQFLGKTYEVVSSYGHIRDLPKSELGIDTEHNFEPKYVIPTKARKTVTQLKKQAKKESDIILATDEDREGESIAWHLAWTLGLDPAHVKRIAFHEITPEAIKDALEHPRTINEALVNAQKARRVLDRLVGYKLSPLLWKKIMGGLSAGRVQSVALRLIVERELERERFKPEEYWILEADLDIASHLLRATLETIDGKKIPKLGIRTQQEAQVIKEHLESAMLRIHDIQRKETIQNPQPPFITSSLQQTAAHKLGFSAALTMSTAQRLYEIGKITYMRTDSTNMAQSALDQAKAYIEDSFGAQYSRPSQWKTKVKLAQEAHEAIRPTNFSVSPDSLKEELEPRQFKLYRLIWQRALASQMTPARIERTNIVIDTDKSPCYTLSIKGSRLLFDGFTKVYPAAIEDRILPDIQKNDAVSLKEVIPSQNFTQPSARFSEATLIKAMKDFGIGRPSTYASIIEVIKKRRYVEKDEHKKFFPTLVGRKVNELLTEHFPDIVDVDFTARMEEDLDEIAQGNKEWGAVIKAFYTPFEEQIVKKQAELTKRDFVQEETDKTCPTCGSAVLKKLGRFGEYFACSRYPAECKWTQHIKETIGMKCPECSEGDIVVKRTRKGKIFYGCSRYPECKYASWKKPKLQEDNEKTP